MLRANLGDILVFMAVVDEGSFVAGGKAMGLSRSAAGKAVGRLEDRLGVRLLNRTTRAIGLTDEGRVFYERALRISSAVDEAEASVAGSAGAPRGLLRITVPDAFGRLVVMPLLGKYLAAWPELKVEVSFTDRRVDLVEEGFDLAVRIGEGPADTRLVSRVVAKYAALLVASPAYVATHGAPSTIDELAAHEHLVFSSESQRQSWRLLDVDGAWVEARGRSRFRLDSGEALRDAAIAGLGIAYLPTFLVADDLANGRLVRLLPRLEAASAKIVVLYPTKRMLEPRVRRFIDTMVDALGDTL